MPRNDRTSVEVLRQFFEATHRMSESEVEMAVQNAAQSPNAVVFVYVPWAPMRPQIDRFAEFTLAWQSDHENSSIGFHFINFGEVCDDYRPLSSLPGWPIRDEGRYVGQLGGWGELVWIANGRVVHIQTALDFSDASELVAFTRAVIGVEKHGEALVATGRQW